MHVQAVDVNKFKMNSRGRKREFMREIRVRVLEQNESYNS